MPDQIYHVVSEAVYTMDSDVARVLIVLAVIALFAFIAYLGYKLKTNKDDRKAEADAQKSREESERERSEREIAAKNMRQERYSDNQKQVLEVITQNTQATERFMNMIERSEKAKEESTAQITELIKAGFSDSRNSLDRITGTITGLVSNGFSDNKGSMDKVLEHCVRCKDNMRRVLQCVEKERS